MNNLLTSSNQTIVSNNYLSSKQKLSLMLLNKHFNINTSDSKVSTVFSKSLKAHKKIVDCLPLLLKKEKYLFTKVYTSSLFFIKDFSIFLCLLSFNLNLKKTFIISFGIKFLNQYTLNIICFKKLYSLFSLKNAKYFFLVKKLKGLIGSKHIIHEVFTSFFLLSSYVINECMLIFNHLSFLNFKFYCRFLINYTSYSKISSYLFLFSFLKNTNNIKTMSSIFFRFYFAYKFKLLNLTGTSFNVFSYNNFIKNPQFWLAFNKENFVKANISVDTKFLTYIREWTVTNTLFFVESNKNINYSYLNYTYILNSNYSYSNFLTHLIGLITKKGLRLKSFKVVFLLSLKLFKLTLAKNNTLFLSDSLSKIQPMFRVLKTKIRGKAKMMPQGLTASKLYSFSYTTLIKHSRLRSENTILLKLFSEILDISAYKGSSLKTKVLNLKLFIQNKYNISSKNAFNQSGKQYRNRQIL